MFNKYILAAIILLVIDFFFIFSVRNLFNNIITTIQGEKMKINIMAASLAYLFLVVVYNYFIVRDNRGMLDAFILGVCIYGVYEFTNKALIKKWQTKAIILDTIWGGVLFALTTFVSQKILS